MPLLLLHLASMFGAVLSPRVEFAVTVLVLHVHSMISTVEHVGITPDFISYILKEKKRSGMNRNVNVTVMQMEHPPVTVLETAHTLKVTINYQLLPSRN